MSEEYMSVETRTETLVMWLKGGRFPLIGQHPKPKRVSISSDRYSTVEDKQRNVNGTSESVCGCLKCSLTSKGTENTGEPELEPERKEQTSHQH